MRLAAAAILFASTAASADSSVHVLSVKDPSAKLTAELVTAGIGAVAVTSCELANQTVVAGVVYEHGKAATVTVGARGPVEDCVAKALRATKLDTGGSKVGVVVAVAVTKPAAKALDPRDRKSLDVVLERNLGTNLSKFE